MSSMSSKNSAHLGTSSSGGASDPVTPLQRELLGLYVAIEDKARLIAGSRDNAAYNEAVAAAKGFISEYESRLQSLLTLASMQSKQRSSSKPGITEHDGSPAPGALDTDRHRSDLDTAKRSLRAAQLAARQRIDAAQRNELFSGDLDMSTLRKRRDNERVQSESANRTTSLTKLIRTMDQQVRQSEATMESLLQSSSTLMKTRAEYATAGTAIHKSSKLLNKYARRETTDFVLIVLALCLYFGTCLYIVKARLWGSGGGSAGA